MGGLSSAEFGGKSGCHQHPRLRTLWGSALCFLVLQLAEALSRYAHDITETQMSLSNLSSELMKNRDQVHADRRSVGFSFLVGWGWGQGCTAQKVQ